MAAALRSERRPTPVAGVAATVWALVGVAVILTDAIARVWPYAWDGLRHGLTPPQWIVLIGWTAAMLIGEGYRGFQKRFAPRVTARAFDLLLGGSRSDRLLAPLYCIGYFHAPRRVIISSWSLTAGITLLIVIVRTAAQPWRGIIDTGVLAGMTYGLVATAVCVAQHWRRRRQ